MKTNKEMISEVITEIEKHNVTTKRNRKTLITVIAVLSIIICLGIGAGAKNSLLIGSREFISYLKEKTENADSTEIVEEIRQQIANSDDIFSVASRNDENFRQILLDRESSLPINMTVTNGGYIFTFESITEGKKLNNVMVGGSLADGTAEYEWQVADSLYAIFKISRTDGAKLTEENYAFFRHHNLIAGYDPTGAYMNFTNDAVYYQDEYCYYMAIELNNMLPFAEDDFVICLFDATQTDPDPREVYWAKNDGAIGIKDDVQAAHALFRFSVDKKYANENAKNEFLKNREYLLNKNFEKYYQ